MRMHAVLAALLLLAVPAASPADPFSEYRIPDHSWRSGTLRGYASGVRAHQSNTGFETNVRNGIAAAWGAFEYGRDTDRLTRRLTVDAQVDMGGERRDGRYNAGTAYPGDVEGREASSGRSLRLGAEQRATFGDAGWAVGAGASWLADFHGDWGRNDQTWSSPGAVSFTRDYHRYDWYGYSGSAAVTVGRGRVRDATVVMDVHVLEERLLAEGVITSPLSAATRERLAEVLAAGGEIAAVHERPGRFFWREVERVLREGGALGERGLDAYSLLRVREPYALAGLARRRGEYVGVRLDGRHQQRVERRRMEYSSRYYDAGVLAYDFRTLDGEDRSIGSDDVFAGIEGEIHRPLDWRWQLDASGSVAVPVSTGDEGLEAYANLEANRLVADRWLAGVRFESLRTYLRHDEKPADYVRDGWRTTLGATVRWFVEDHVSLDAALVAMQQKQNYGGANKPYSSDIRATLGLTYRFLGRFEAPGLIGTMRPLS